MVLTIKPGITGLSQISGRSDLTFEEEVKNFRCDLVISNATIEHVGKFENQIKMMKNIIKYLMNYFQFVEALQEQATENL